MMARWAASMGCVLAVAVLGCSNCGGAVTQVEPDYEPQGAATAELRLVSVGLDDDERLSFAVYLDRPDLGETQPDNTAGRLYTADLPVGLRPKLMYVSDPSDEVHDSGRLCDRPRFPHRCEVTLSAEQRKRESNEFLVKILFEDQRYAALRVVVPRPPRMDPVPILDPQTTPAQGSQLSMRFGDVGADRYDVEVRLCHPYANDGINPCLDGDDFVLLRSDGGVALQGARKDATVELQNGVISLRSTMRLEFSDSVRYAVRATEEHQLSAGIKARVQRTTVLNHEP